MSSAPFKSAWRFVDNKFTRFALRIDGIVQERNLLNVPEQMWTFFSVCVYINFGCGLVVFIGGVLCLILGLYYSTFFTRINCESGVNIFLPLNNLIATWTGFFAVKALHIRWSAFVHLVFTAAMTPLMFIAGVFAATQVPIWHEEQRMSRGGTNWGTKMADGDLLLSIFSLSSVVLSICELYVYYKYWMPGARMLRVPQTPA